MTYHILLILISIFILVLYYGWYFKNYDDLREDAAISLFIGGVVFIIILIPVLGHIKSFIPEISNTINF